MDYLLLVAAKPTSAGHSNSQVDIQQEYNLHKVHRPYHHMLTQGSNIIILLGCKEGIPCVHIYISDSYIGPIDCNQTYVYHSWNMPDPTQRAPATSNMCEEGPKTMYVIYLLNNLAPTSYIINLIFANGSIYR